METLISGMYDDLAFARQAERARSISYSTILGNQSLIYNRSRRLLGNHIVDIRSAQGPSEVGAFVSYGHPKTGKFTKSIDKAPPPHIHTRLLYQGRSKYQASISCQLRTGISRLNRYLGTIGAAASTEFQCQRGVETVDHFLFRCALWSEHRREIRGLAGPRWGDTSYLLGGWSGPVKDGLFERWKPNAEMITATIQFAINTTRLNDKRGGEEISPDLKPSSLD